MRFFFFFPPLSKCPKTQKPPGRSWENCSMLGTWGGAPHKGWGSGGLRRGAGQREEGWGARGAGHFILWAQSCPHISARSLLLPLPRILAPQPRGQRGGDGAAPPGGTGRKRRDSADPQQHNKVPARPRWCWRCWVRGRAPAWPPAPRAGWGQGWGHRGDAPERGQCHVPQE